MAFGESWHIKSRSHQCAVTGNQFADGETIIAAIFPDPESSGWLRRDYSLAGWEQRDVAEGEKFSQWKTTYKAPVSSERVEVTKESPIDLLRRMVDEDEEHTEKVRFILAVMLERQKVLVEKDTQAVPSGILRVYEHRKEGDVFLIRDPNVALDQVEAMQQEVLDLLENHGRKPVVAEVVADDATVERQVENDLNPDPVEEMAEETTAAEETGSTEK